MIKTCEYWEELTQSLYLSKHAGKKLNSNWQATQKVEFRPGNEALFHTVQLIKVSYFQKEFMKSSFLPKYEKKNLRISAL